MLALELTATIITGVTELIAVVILTTAIMAVTEAGIATIDIATTVDIKAPSNLPNRKGATLQEATPFYLSVSDNRSCDEITMLRQVWQWISADK
jgi:hypothetical protein